MKSTSKRNEKTPPYLGVDLTDRHSGGGEPRPIDVCGLFPDGIQFRSQFWTWLWDPGHSTLDVTGIAEEIRHARWTFIDGPQALAAQGSTMRDCERKCSASGKTLADWKSIERLKNRHEPFAGFVLSSLELFAGLQAVGLAISPPGFNAPPEERGLVAEYYPGNLWNKRIVTPVFRPNNKRQVVLRRKGSHEGRLARERILSAFGVVFPDGTLFPTISSTHVWERFWALWPMGISWVYASDRSGRLLPVPMPKDTCAKARWRFSKSIQSR